MPAYPYTIENGHGESLTWLRVVHEAGGDRIEAEAVAQPGAGPPMHVHKLQEEAARVVSGKMGYQLLDGQKHYAGPGELVVWPPGMAHNVEFHLSAIFASMKESGAARPGIFDAAFLLHRYRAESGMLEIPAPVQRIVFPIVVFIGTLLGKYTRYADAPTPIAR